eukprot:TRINITY_DN1761_c0_g1_i1.p1 TRINITY_DN1761_c0_g1~~TRINITY_DN1761_c0_g1_i1.p1  ORF type:complete len:501 (+),score=66.35 TRINITY_DN1761_c0_g1_i1:92-1594(+)
MKRPTRDTVDPDDLYRENETEEQRNQKAKQALSIRSEHTLRSENLPFDIDVWYPTVAQFTFPSYFLPLTRQEARAMINMYQTSILRRKWLRLEDVDVLRNLEQRLEEVFQKHFQGKSAFMRLCGRSPKDADPLDPEDILAEYEDQLADLVKKNPDMDPTDPNTRFVAFTKVNWMKVRNAREVMNLLLTSERVHVDMDDWLRYGEPEQIVLREFEPELTVDNEFRAYVYKNRLNGISQYDHYGVFPHLAEIKDKIQDKIMALWEVVHPLIGEESYCVDFGYLPSSDSVKLIEISPFLTCTGAACFRWSNERDVEILKNGPMEFRLNHQSHVTDGLIQAGIYERFAADPRRKRYWDFLEQMKPSSPPPFSYKTVMWPCLGMTVGAAAMYLSGAPAIPTLLFGLFTPLLYTQAKEAKLKREFAQKFEDSLKGIKRRSREELKNLIFFYGTLKSGFHWNQKYLSSSEMLCKARTVDPFPLVIGDCGVCDPFRFGCSCLGSICSW